LSFIRRSAVQHIFGATKGAVADVMDAHLETLSMIFLTTCWAIGYGWFEAVIGIGALLGIPGTPGGKVHWYSFFGVFYSSYHLFFGFTIFVITFGIGFLKFNRMLYYRKRYLLYTSLASYPWALTVQDFAYFFFSPIFNAGNYELNTHAWTCHGLNLGCVVLANPWKSNADFIIPRWYGVTLLISAVLFFLAYRSALVNLLVTRQVMKESGYLEKVRVKPAPSNPPSIPTEVPELIPSPAPPPAPKKGVMKTPDVARIVDQERDELLRRLVERLERT
jgi:hypothetical protein